MPVNDLANPTQAILVSTRGTADFMGKEIEKDNIITVAWHCPLSFEPELYGICIGKSRFSCGLISESKVFAVNFISHDLRDKALLCGRTTGASVDKFAKSGLTKEECESIDCPRIKEASAVLECEVIDQFETGDHMFFVGQVHKAVGKNDKKRLFHLGSDKFSTTM